MVNNFPNVRPVGCRCGVALLSRTGIRQTLADAKDVGMLSQTPGSRSAAIDQEVDVAGNPYDDRDCVKGDMLASHKINRLSGYWLR